MITPPADANVSIQFGTDTTYGLTTWTQPALAGGGPVIIYVAGIRANTAYHTRAVVQFSGNATVNDSDHIFKTASLPAAQIPTLTAATTAGQTPQSGLELLNFFTSSIRYQGDLTLMNGADPVDWQYAQHDANVASSNSR